jgi:hypothetical protein
MSLEKLLLFAALAAAADGCGDRASKSQDTSGRAQAAGEGDVAATGPREPGGSTSSLDGLATPGLGGASAASRDAGPAASPEDREKLRAVLDKALAENRLDEAIATADVLEVLFPDDPVILELRGRALSRQGDPEGSARDLGRCCELGRAACCAGKPR